MANAGTTQPRLQDMMTHIITYADQKPQVVDYTLITKLPQPAPLLPHTRADRSISNGIILMLLLKKD